MVEPVSIITFVIQYGPWGVVVALLYFFVQLIRTGELVPKAQYKLVEDSMNEWKSLAEKWQEVAMTGSLTAKEGSEALRGVLRTVQDVEQLRDMLIQQSPPPGSQDKKT